MAAQRSHRSAQHPLASRGQDRRSLVATFAALFILASPLAGQETARKSFETSWYALHHIITGESSADPAEVWNDAWERIESPANGYGTDPSWEHDSYWNRLIQVGVKLGVRHVGSSRRPTPGEVVARLAPYKHLAQPQSAGAWDYLQALIELDRGRPDLARAHNEAFVAALLPDPSDPDPAVLREHRSRLVDALSMRARINYATGDLRQAVREVEGLLALMSELEHAPEYGGVQFAPADHIRVHATLGSLLTDLTATDPSQAPRAREAFDAALTRAIEDERALDDVDETKKVDYSEDKNSAWTRRALLEILLGNFEAARRNLDLAAGLPVDKLALRSQLFRVALQVRVAREQGDVTGLDRLSGELEATFAELLDHWRAGVSMEGGSGYLTYGRTRFALCEALTSLIGPAPTQASLANALDFLIELQSLGVLSRELGAPGTRVEQVRESLLGEPGNGLVTFVPGKDRLHVFAMTRETILHDEIRILEPVLEERLRAFHSQLYQPGAEREGATRKLAARLFTDLMPGEVGRAVASWERILVVDREMLGGLAFGALWDGEGWLGLSAQVCEAPSLPLSVQLASRIEDERQGRTWQLELYADEPVPDLPPLQRRERGDSPWSREVVRLNADAATVANVRAALASGDVFVWTTVAHGLDSETEVRSTQLALGNNERIGIESLPDLAVPPVVLLGMCRAGAAMPRLGDPAVGHLGGAALRGGALAVVLSSLDLELQSHTVFEAAFLAELDAGNDCGEAFRRGLVALDRAGYGPSIWARYTLLGSADLGLPRSPGPSRWPLLLGVATVLTLASLALRLRGRARA